MKIFETLKSARVFFYFEEISKIPHISHHEKALSDYCVNFAGLHGLYCEQDSMGNVLIIKEASDGYEEVPPVILQGHLDMVGAKLPTCPLDLEKEAISLLMKGDYIYADGTTLGGDNGVAIAYALAILESDTIRHPRLEVIFTVCEEVGLLGASAMELSSCKARRLINLDSEQEGILTVGCAGGRRALCTIPVTRMTGSGDAFAKDSFTCRNFLCHITVEGLLGGHSGTEIHKGRANAIVVLGRILLYLENRLYYGLVSLNGGNKENVIPDTASAHILVEEKDRTALKSCLEQLQEILLAEYATSDSGIRIRTGFETPSSLTAPLTPASLKKVLTALTLAPCGVQSMSADLPGLVETSLNMGVATLTDTELLLRFSIRSSVTTAKEYIADKLSLLTVWLDGTIEFVGDYPAWPYQRISPLRDTCVKIYEKMYGNTPRIDIIHAGLECGILSAKIEGLDCISFGPDLYDIHSPNEHMSISSVDRVWEYLLAVLAVK